MTRKTKLASLIRTYNLQPGASLARFIGTGELSERTIRRYTKLNWVMDSDGGYPFLTVHGWDSN